MQKIFSLTQSAVKILAEQYSTPLLVLSTEQIAHNYQLLQTHLPAVKIHYAVKANPDERIIATLDKLGSYFDVASDGEMLSLTNLNIAPDRMIYANPVKTANGLVTAKNQGIFKMTFDSESEIYKMAKVLPGATVLLRIRVDNPDALVDLNKKFGAPAEDAIRLLTIARDQGLTVGGLCFHVGSQSPNAKAYIVAMELCHEIFQQAQAIGIDLALLDIGGGFPIPTSNEDFDIEFMLTQIRESLDRLFPNTEIWAEPGRIICGTAVNLITRVIGTQERNEQQWYFLDEGLYGSFSGIIFDHWEYELISFKVGKQITATFAGPSCDSLDVLFRDIPTVVLDVDDVLLVPNCGAYTSASATVFNGFAKAPYIIWEDVAERVISDELCRTAG